MTNASQLSSIFSERVSELAEHLEQNMHGARIADAIEEESLAVLRSYGAIHRNTSIISHGMQEYKQPLTRFDYNGTRVGLRHSQQFDKQLIVLATGVGYCQRSGAFRPGDAGKFHTPYFNLVDFEFPFNKSDVPFADACQKAADILTQSITKSLMRCGLKVSDVVKITHAESIERYNTGDPYFSPGKNDIALTLVFNPPLFTDCDTDEINTCMNPVMMPIFDDACQAQAFSSGQMSLEEMKSLRVHGFDAIISCPKMFSDHEQPRGLEVGGGGARINDVNILHRVVSMVRNETYETYLPLMAVLEHFQNANRYTAGGAIGFDRLCMAAAGVDQIIKIQSLPWHQNGTPNFCR